MISFVSIGTQIRANAYAVISSTRGADELIRDTKMGGGGVTGQDKESR